MEEIKDEIVGILRYHNGVWGRQMDAPVLNSDGNLILVFQDANKEGILDVQREAYKTYLQNEEKYKSCVTYLLLDYYKWNNEYFMRSVSGIDETYHKDVITEEKLFTTMTLWHLFICRDGSFGYAFGCCWDKENGIAVLLSESEPRVISRTQLKNLHKLNDPTVGLLVHDGKKAWKGLEINSFFGNPENLEIELEGSVGKVITAAQKKAYAKYLQNKDNIYKDFSKMMLAIYAGGEEKAAEMLNLGFPINMKTILPKTLYIDRKGNFGWICYTDWNKDYVDVLLSEDKPYVLQHGYLKSFAKLDPIIDKEMGVFFDDYNGLKSTVIVRIGTEILTLPFEITFYDEERVLNDEIRDSFKKYKKFSENFWNGILLWVLSYYQDTYEELEEQYDLPQELQENNINKNSVMALADIRKLYMKYNGRAAWLCEFPTAPDGLAFEFTHDFIDMISQSEII